MARRKIIWSARAKSEFKDILEFYTLRNGNKNYSRKLSNQVKYLISFLSDHPYLGKASTKESYRIIIRGHYEILYRVDEHIIISSVWDTRRNPEEKNF